MARPCTGDTIVDYITLNEKKNLFKLLIALDEYKCTLEYLKANSKLDNARIVKLEATVTELQGVIDGYQSACNSYKEAYSKLDKANKALSRSLKLAKVKGWLGGAFGTIGGIGAGIGVGIAIFKL